MPQEIGDAILRFLGDSTDLDMKLGNVQPDTEKAFVGAADAVEEGTGRMKASMFEAQGEAMLLGEEFGIHLPRHVTRFIAGVDGIGPALSAAFSATAVIFLAQALVQATDKLSNFIGNTVVFTDDMRASNQIVSDGNTALESLNKQREAAIAKLAELQGATKDQEAAEINATHATVEHAQAELAALKSQIANKGWWESSKDAAGDYAGVLLGMLAPGYVHVTSAARDYAQVQAKQQELTLIEAQAARALAAEKAAQAEEQRQKAINVGLIELEDQKKVALAYAQTEQQKYDVELHFGERRLALLKELGDKEKSQVAAQLSTIEALQITHAQKVQAAFTNMMRVVQQQKSQALDALSNSVVANTIAFTPAEAAMERFNVAARNLGITLRDDLVNNLNKAKEAENAFISAGLAQEGPEWKQIEDAIKNAQQALDNFGKSEDAFKANSQVWKQFARDMRDGVNAVDDLKVAGAAAFDSLQSSIGNAFASIVMGQRSVGAALEKALAQSLASISAQAAVKALFYTAEGFAALAGFEDTSAAQYFMAAGEMAAVAVAAGIAGHELAGAGGSCKRNLTLNRLHQKQPSTHDIW